MRARTCPDPSFARKRGFTLLELAVVVGVIAIMAAILFPVFARAREAARSATCRSNLHQIAIAAQMYARDYDGRLPAAHNDFRPLAVPYLNHLTVLLCPSDANGASRRDTANGPRHPGLIALPEGRLPSGYQFRGGLTREARGDTPLAGDWQFRHTGVANVAYLSGEVAGVRPDEWTPFAPDPRAPGAGPTVTETLTPFLGGQAAQGKEARK